KKFVFVLGTGRSGTHFLGRLIGKNPSCHLLLESEETFPLSIKANITHYHTIRHKNRLIKKYNKLIQKATKPFIIEKSHQNIWSFEDLYEIFSDSLFIGIQRDVKQVVNSMLEHRGVLKWFDRLD